jgi:serine/threonine-protein kinase
VQDFAPWVPPAAAAIVRKALAIDASQRFQTADEMRAAIDALLPNGRSIQKTMFAPLPPEVRGSVAPRLTAPGATPVSPTMPMTAISSATPATSDLSATITSPAAELAGSIAGGLAQSRAAAPTRSALLPATLGAAVILGGLGVGAWRYLGSKAEPATRPASTSAAVSPPAATAPPSSETAQAPFAQDAAPSTKTVQVVVAAPPDTKVEVDDVVTSVEDGAVELSGTVGSTHHIKLSRGKQSAPFDVHVTSDGPVPSSVALSAPVAAASPAAAGSAAVAHAGKQAPAACKLQMTMDKAGNPHFSCPCDYCP